MPSSQKSSKEKRAADRQDLAYLNSLTASHAELVDTPKSHYLFIGAVECISTALPIGLFFTQYYRADSLLEAAPQFAIGTFVGAVVLAFAVNKWAVAVRKTLHAEREQVISTKTPAEKSALKQSAFVERFARPSHPILLRLQNLPAAHPSSPLDLSLPALSLPSPPPTPTQHRRRHVQPEPVLLPLLPHLRHLRAARPQALRQGAPSPLPIFPLSFVFFRSPHLCAHSVLVATHPTLSAWSPSHPHPYPSQSKNNYMFSSMGAAAASLAVCSVYHSIKL